MIFALFAALTVQLFCCITLYKALRCLFYSSVEFDTAAYAELRMTKSARLFRLSVWSVSGYFDRLKTAMYLSYIIGFINCLLTLVSLMSDAFSPIISLIIAVIPIAVTAYVSLISSPKGSDGKRHLIFNAYAPHRRSALQKISREKSKTVFTGAAFIHRTKMNLSDEETEKQIEQIKIELNLSKL